MRELSQNPRAAYNREWRAKNKDKVNAYFRARYAVKRERIAQQRLAREYGLSPEAVDALIKKQRCLCAICERDLGKFRVDHCHRTGIVRGLLCNMCNLLLGQCGDDLPGVMRFVRYLQRAEVAAHGESTGAP